MCATDEGFERRLYIIRRRARHAVRRLEIPEQAKFYVPSLSSRTIVYKGMLNARPDRTQFYPDLCDPRGRVGAGPGPLALLDQHLPELGPRASLPL